MPVSRRNVLAGAGAGAGVALIGATDAAAAKGHHPGHAPHRHGGDNPPIGPLVDDPAGRLALPAGFSYRVISQVGVTKLTTGEPSPDRPDGMGAFRTRHSTLVTQNHEISPKYSYTYPVPTTEGTVYDEGLTGASGGVTIIELSHDNHRRREWVGLSGTLNNCAGGVTPWGTWLTCEEDTSSAGTVYSGKTLAKDHGYVFEVVPGSPSEQHPVPIKAWGRFPHEAAVIAHDRRTVYLTEDNSKGLFYRWLAPHGPLRRGDLHRLGANAGRLQAMQVSFPRGGGLVSDLSELTSADIGRELDVAWFDVPDRQSVNPPTKSQTYSQPVTTAKKLEGAWGDKDGVWFASSFSFATDVSPDGVPHDGQLWFYDYRTHKLVLNAYYPYVDKNHDGTWSLAHEKEMNNDVFDGPDNVHVSPWGGLVIAEDGVGVNGLIGFTEKDGSFRLARNDVDFNGDNSEMTGPVFSPDHRVLYANAQEPGHTYAIGGPFKRYLQA